MTLHEQRVIVGQLVGRQRIPDTAERPRVELNKALLAERLQAIAAARGVTIADLARAAGVTRQWVTWTLRSARGLTISSAALLAHVAGIPFETFTKGCVRVVRGRIKEKCDADLQAEETGDTR